jgi:hypothetical protein
MSLWEEAARLNHAPSLFKLGELYFQGKTTEPKATAIVPSEDLGKECDGHSLPSQHTTPEQAELDVVVALDLHQAVFYWGLAAELDCPKAIHALAVVHEFGLGPVAPSGAKAAALHELAAYCWVQQHHPVAAAAAGQSSGSNRRRRSSSSSGGRGGSDGGRGSAPAFALPHWLKMANGKFPEWQQRRYLAAKRPAPALASLSSRSASARGAGLGSFTPLATPRRAGAPGTPGAAVAAVAAAAQAASASAAAAAEAIKPTDAAAAGAAALAAATAQFALAAAGGAKARFVRKLEALSRAEVVSGSTFAANFEDLYLLPHALARGNGAPTPTELRAAAANVARGRAPFAVASLLRQPFQPHTNGPARDGRLLVATARDWRLPPLEAQRAAIEARAHRNGRASGGADAVMKAA